MTNQPTQNDKTRQEYTKPVITNLGSYIELTQTDGSQPVIDGGPPYTAGRVS